MLLIQIDIVKKSIILMNLSNCFVIFIINNFFSFEF